jgi:hypothetical protein
MDTVAIHETRLCNNPDDDSTSFQLRGKLMLFIVTKLLDCVFRLVACIEELLRKLDVSVFR